MSIYNNQPDRLAVPCGYCATVNNHTDACYQQRQREAWGWQPGDEYVDYDPLLIEDLERGM